MMKNETIEKIKRTISVWPANIAGSEAKAREFRDRLDDAIDAVYKDGEPVDQELVALMYEVGNVADWLGMMRPGDKDFPGCEREFRSAVNDVRARLDIPAV